MSEFTQIDDLNWKDPDVFFRLFVALYRRKSLSWHTALRIRRKSEKRDKDGRKTENGYRKSQDSLANKVSVKVESVMTAEFK